MLKLLQDHAADAQAVTSSGSAEQIAVSSLITYDLYGTYINPRASAKQLIAVSRTVVVLYGLVMGMSALPSDNLPLQHTSKLIAMKEALAVGCSYHRRASQVPCRASSTWLALT